MQTSIVVTEACDGGTNYIEIDGVEYLFSSTKVSAILFNPCDDAMVDDGMATDNGLKDMNEWIRTNDCDFRDELIAALTEEADSHGNELPELI